MDRRAWQATVHGVAKSWTQLSDLTKSVPHDVACKQRMNSPMILDRKERPIFFIFPNVFNQIPSTIIVGEHFSIILGC